MARPGRPSDKVALDDVQRKELERLSRRRKAPRHLALRAKIVLECAQGLSDRAVATKLGVSAQTAAKWRKRFLSRGLDGLYDEPRAGRHRSVTDQGEVAIMAKTLAPPPKGAARWTAAAVAAATGCSESTVSRRWRQWKVHPERLVCDRLNPDLERYGIWSVAGVYRASGHRAVAIIVDAPWRDEVPPIVWGQRKQSRRTSPAPNQPDQSPGGGAAQAAFEDFLDDVARCARDDRELFLIVDGPRLHEVALRHQHRAGRMTMHVSHTVSTKAWRDIVKQLVDVMGRRQAGCTAHDDCHTLAAVQRKRRVVWRDSHARAQETGACQCRHRRPNPGRSIRTWRTTPGQYRKCECNRPDCPDCCLRRYWNIVARLSQDWDAAFGSGPVLFITLTYRASSALTPAEWLRRARLDFKNLRRRWKRKRGEMPHYLWSLEFTASGTPHFHVMIPCEGDQDFQELRRQLPSSWRNIAAAGPNPGPGSQYSARVVKRESALDVIRYLLKSLQVPLSHRPAPAGTPPFRRWGRSRNWATVQRPQ